MVKLAPRSVFKQLLHHVLRLETQAAQLFDPSLERRVDAVCGLDEVMVVELRRVQRAPNRHDSAAHTAHRSPHHPDLRSALSRHCPHYSTRRCRSRAFVWCLDVRYTCMVHIVCSAYSVYCENCVYCVCVCVCLVCACVRACVCVCASSPAARWLGCLVFVGRFGDFGTGTLQPVV